MVGVWLVGLVVGLVLVTGCFLVVRSRHRVLPVGDTTDGVLACPSCAHRFKRPDIMVVTKAVVQKYGPNPVQCPRCSHIWSTGGDRHWIRDGDA